MARCAICGRQTAPAVFIGDAAIGPTCAKKAGFIKGRMAKGSLLRFVAPKLAAKGPHTPDLFAELLAGGGQ